MTHSTTETAAPATIQPMRIHAQPALRRVWRAGYGLAGSSLALAVGVALASAASAFGLIPRTVSIEGVATAGGLAMLGMAAGVWFANLRFKRYLCEYHPRAGVQLLDGVWWQTETWIPAARLQHLDVKQGPLDRQWGTATLSLHTAGTHDHVLHIKGLTLEQAQALRTALLPHLHAHHA